MGCWNGTCGLSGLPIIHGTDMYVFPIVESYSDSFCYSSALYKPSVVPFRAEYNDYGAGENCTGPALEILVEGIRDKLVEIDLGENKYHDIAVKRKGFDVEMFFEACHEKRLRFQNPMSGYKNYPQTLDVFFTMIRKDVADRLWNEWSFDKWKGSEAPCLEGFECDKYYIKNVTYAKLAETIPEYMEIQFARFQELVKPLKDMSADPEKKNLVDNKFYNLFNNFFFSAYDERDHILSDILSHIFGSGYADGGFSNIGDLKTTIILKYAEGDKESAHELIRECLVGYMIDSFMGSVRKVWLPPMHQGSQSEELETYKLLNSITNDIVDGRNSEFESDE